MLKCPYYTLEACTNVDKNDNPLGIEHCPEGCAKTCMFAILADSYDDDWCIPDDLK